ncbi:MAG: homoserine dehydrogenase [Leptospiraceae bacterium]|nr:homoserine dehydrogenase [Leptospiraceae bacterium]MDW8306369.1 homoserine dehydrogenase [Leptospiraceae bacterium]
MLQVGLFGLGNVGQSFLKILRQKKLPVQVVAVVDRSFARKKDILQEIPASDDPSFILNQTKLDAVVELIGGSDTALFAAKECLKKGIPFVTANKALLAEHGYSLFSLAQENHTSIYFEAAVAGAIPIIHNLQNVYSWEKLEFLEGILNGTTNYILTRMHREKKEYETILSDAQKLGLAESNPRLDVEGIDAAQKLCLLTTLCTSTFVDIERVFYRGIHELTLQDVVWAQRMDYRIKLLARAFFKEEEIFLGVEPTFVKSGHDLYDIQEENNAIYFKGEFSENHLFVGKGAGGFPTASAVVCDLLRIMRGEKYPWPKKWHYARVQDIGTLPTSYYVRFLVQDIAGVLAQVSEVFRDHNISIAVLHQEQQQNDRTAEIVLTTHETTRTNILETLRKLTLLKEVMGRPVYYPIVS